MYKVPNSELMSAAEIQAALDDMEEEAQNAALQRSRAKYHYPKTKDEWWAVVNNYWDDLLLVVGKYVNLSEFSGLKGEEFVTETLLSTAIKAKRDKNTDLVMLFENAWSAAPDSGSIHGNAAWGILCDLCSESYLLFEDFGGQN